MKWWYVNEGFCATETKMVIAIWSTGKDEKDEKGNLLQQKINIF